MFSDGRSRSGTPAQRRGPEKVLRSVRSTSAWISDRARWLLAGRPGVELRRSSRALYDSGRFEEAVALLDRAHGVWPSDLGLTFDLAAASRYGLVSTDRALELFDALGASGLPFLARRALRDAMNLAWERRGAEAALDWSRRLLEYGRPSRREILRIAALWHDAGATDRAFALLDDVSPGTGSIPVTANYLQLTAAAAEFGKGPSAASDEARRILECLDRGRRLFDELVAPGTDVALVANGPTLRGKGLGRAIDGHRTVVRFNNHTGGSGLDDQGERTDIWIRSPYLEYVPLRTTEGLRLFVLTGANLTHRFSDGLEILRPFLATGIPVCVVPPEVYRSLHDTLDASPSCGLIGLKWVADRFGGTIDSRHVFGFSPGDNTSGRSRYYDGERVGRIPSRHNWSAEQALVGSLRVDRDGNADQGSLR